MFVKQTVIDDLKRRMRKYYTNANMMLRKFSYCSFSRCKMLHICLNITVL